MLYSDSLQGFNCFLLFFLWGMCTCVPVSPDRRTNPFGETDDECSTESDGKHP